MKKLKSTVCVCLLSCLFLFGICFSACERENSDANNGGTQTGDEQNSDAKKDGSVDNGKVSAYIDSLIENTPAEIPYWNKEAYKGRWNYIDGVFIKSLLDCYDGFLKTDAQEAERYKNFIVRYVNYYVDETGQFINLKKPEKSGFTEGELDSVCESSILYRLYDITADNRYIYAANRTYSSIKMMDRVDNSPYANFWHKKSYPYQVWLDGMYMYVPFYAEYAARNSENSIFDEIKTQYAFIRKNMFNEEKGLYYHGYDATKSIFWADKNSGCSPSFWTRSQGWYLCSLVDSIGFFPWAVTEITSFHF